MKGRHLARVTIVALCFLRGGTAGLSQSQPLTHGPAVGGEPAWFLQGSFPDPGGRTVVEPGGRVTIRDAGGLASGGGRGAALPAATRPPAPPACSRSPVCDNRLGPARRTLQRVEWEQTLGYTFTYPYVLPPGPGGVPSVALDSKESVWVFQRAARGKPQLFKFDHNYQLILQVGEDVIGYQDKAHGMAVDAADNVWICAANGATVMKLSPEGKLLMTIGEPGRRGDWNEARGQRLLW